MRQSDLRVLTLVFVPFLFSGCAEKRNVDLSGASMNAYVELVLPKKIEIMPYITQPTAFGGEDPDGVTAVVEATDAVGDKTKMVGDLHFELIQYRLSQGDRIGDQVALWPVPLDSEESIKLYWDRLTRSYRFPLRIENAKLTPGRYALVARLTLPGGERLADEYELSYEPGKTAQTKPAAEKTQ